MLDVTVLQIGRNVYSNLGLIELLTCFSAEAFLMVFELAFVSK